MYLYFELCKSILEYSDAFYISNICHQTFNLMHCNIKAFL